MEALFGSLGTDPVWDYLFGSSARSRGSLVLSENSKEAHYTGTLDIPGVKREDLSLETEDVSGKRVLHVAWSRHGKPHERFWRLPDDVDADAIDAQLADGVLTLTLPKAKRHQSHKAITIR